MPSRPDVRSVGKAPVLGFYTCVLSLAVLLGFIRRRIMVSCIRYNRV